MGNKFGWRSGVAHMKGLKVGADTTISTEIGQIKVYTPTIAPAQVNLNSISAQTFTVTGLTTADKVVVNPGVNTIGVSGAYASATDTLTVIFTNPTGGNITPASSTWNVIAIRS